VAPLLYRLPALARCGPMPAADAIKLHGGSLLSASRDALRHGRSSRRRPIVAHHTNRQPAGSIGAPNRPNPLDVAALWDQDEATAARVCSGIHRVRLIILRKHRLLQPPRTRRPLRILAFLFGSPHANTANIFFIRQWLPLAPTGSVRDGSSQAKLPTSTSLPLHAH
jgi:hypothetical protein